MIFDESKVYTAFNADELKEGSKAIVANSISDLKDYVLKQNSDNDFSRTIKSIGCDALTNRFMLSDYKYYNLAYLIEKPKEKPKYRPFNAEDNVDLVGRKIIYKKNDKCKAIILWQNASACILRIAEQRMFFSDLLDNWVFDDGSPCGVKLED